MALETKNFIIANGSSKIEDPRIILLCLNIYENLKMRVEYIIKSNEKSLKKMLQAYNEGSKSCKLCFEEKFSLVGFFV